MTTPPDCDPAVYKDGETILIVDMGSTDMEEWVVGVREASNQRVDWHYVGGRVVVRFLGDRARVETAIRQAASDLIERKRRRLQEYNLVEYTRPGCIVAMGRNGFEDIKFP